MSNAVEQQNQIEQEPQTLPFKHAFSWGHPGQLPYFPANMFQQFYPHLHPFQMPMMPPQIPQQIPPPPPCPPAPRLKKLDIYQLDLNQQIGTGFSSIVYKAINTTNNQVVCIKAVDYVGMGPIQKQMVVEEIRILKAVDSENSIRCLDVLESNNFCYIVTDYCEGGDLYRKIKKEGVMAEAVARGYMKGVALAMKQLKDKQIIHRDIKPSNVLLKANTPKLADFGFAVFLSKLNCDTVTNLGSPLYMSPQVLFQNQYSFKSDVFAFGVMFYELLHMVTPWECEKEEELRRKIMTEEVRFKEGVSEETKELINGCLRREPEGRLAIEEVLERLGK